MLEQITKREEAVRNVMHEDSARVRSSTSGSTVDERQKAIDKKSNFFLQLMLQQLKYQTPDEPVDTDKMVQGFTNMTIVQETMNMNKSTNANLEKINQTLIDGRIFSVSGALVGKQAILGGNDFSVTSNLNTVPIIYSIEGDRQDKVKAEIKIFDSNSKLAQSIPLETVQLGEVQVYSVDIQKHRLPEGKYTFAVTAMDKDGKLLPVRTYKTSQIQQVYKDGSIWTADGAKVNFADIIGVQNSSNSEDYVASMDGLLRNVNNAEDRKAFMNLLGKYANKAYKDAKSNGKAESSGMGSI
ncbi:flagellar basal-body rod modification protein FlgD [Alphaproteobacteria bacterium]